MRESARSHSRTLHTYGHDHRRAIFANNRKPNFTMIRCSKNPEYHYGFLFVGQPCFTGCGGFGKKYLVDGETGEIIGEA